MRPPGGRLRVLIGRDRFSERHGWHELARHWPAAVAGRVDVEAVEVGRLDAALRRGEPPVDVVVPVMSPVTAATIGAGSVLHSGVVVYKRCMIGARCIVHAGAVLGADGFGFAPAGDHWEKFPQLGTVVAYSGPGLEITRPDAPEAN